MKQEESLQIVVCNYIKYQYPKVIFFSDMSGIRLTIGQSKKMKLMKSSKGLPDLFICEPRNGCHGLFIELKKDGGKLYKKDGVTPINEHVSEQIEMLKKLYLKGYYAEFAIGFGQAKFIIDNYLKL